MTKTIPAENPDSCWQSLLGLGAAAHEWIERFFWHWFTDGLRANRSGNWGIVLFHPDQALSHTVCAGALRQVRPGGAEVAVF